MNYFFQSRKSLLISAFSILFALFLIFIMAGSNRIKDTLNDMASGSIISKPYSEIQTILPDYFNYLFNTAFWIEAGNFPENFEDVDLNLLDMDALNSMSGVSSINYRNGDIRTSFLLQNGTVEIQNPGDQEQVHGLIPLLKDDLSDREETFRKKMFISPLHNLVSTKEKGFTISLDITDSPPVSVSLDISLSRFIQFYKGIFTENAVLFSTFNSSDFITIPLDKALIDETSESLQLYYDKLILSVLDQVEFDSPNKPHMIEYDGKRWFVLLFKLEDYASTSGFILPESELFFSQFDRIYFFMAIPFVLLFFILITLFFISRYHEKTRISETEKLLKLIEKGESKFLEFKSSLRWDYRENCLNKKLEEVILKSIAAFANSKGGVLLIGVDDDGTPLGLAADYQSLKHQDRDGFELHLRNLSTAMYGTFVSRNMDVEFFSILGKDLCKISLKPASSALFTSMTNKSGAKQEQFYIRDGNMSRRVESLKDITDYCRKRF